MSDRKSTKKNSISDSRNSNFKLNVLPKKKNKKTVTPMDYFCGKNYLIGVCISFFVLYFVAFFAVIKRHHRILSYLHQKEELLVNRNNERDKINSLTNTVRDLKSEVKKSNLKPDRSMKLHKTMPSTRTESVEHHAPITDTKVQNIKLKSADADEAEKSSNKTKEKTLTIQSATVDCTKWKLSDIDTNIDFATFFNSAAIAKQKTDTKTVADPYISPWLYIVIPVADSSPSKLRTTIRSIFNELNSVPGGLYDDGVVQILVVNMGGNGDVAMTLSVLKDEIKNYPYASAFTFVRTIGQHGHSSQPSADNKNDANIFQNTCFMELKLPQKVVELTSRGIAFLSYLVPRIFEKMNVEPCHAFIILKPGESICQFGLPFIHYALGKADEYNWDWTSVRMSYADISGTAFRCNLKRGTEMARAMIKIGDELTQQRVASSEDNDGKEIKINEKTIMARYMEKYKGTIEPMVFKQSLLAGQCNYRPSNPGYDKNKCMGTDISPCDHSVIDSSLRYASQRVDHIHIDGNSKITLGMPGQNCNEACDTETNGKLKCDHVETSKFNNCYNLRGFLDCQSCLIDVKMNGLSGVTSNNNYANGACHYHANTCVYARNAGGGCGGKDVDLRRVCVCNEHGGGGNVKGNSRMQQNKKGGTSFAGEYGESCDDVCQKRKMICIDSELSTINNCNAITKLFGTCRTCEQNEGPDQPCQVNPASSLNTHGECLIKSNVETLTCKGKHAMTRRACVCFKDYIVYIVYIVTNMVNISVFQFDGLILKPDLDPSIQNFSRYTKAGTMISLCVRTSIKCNKSKIDISVFKEHDKYNIPLINEDGIPLTVVKEANALNIIFLRNMKLYYLMSSLFASFDFVSDLIDWTEVKILRLFFSEHCNFTEYGFHVTNMSKIATVSDLAKFNTMIYNKDNNVYYDYNANCSVQILPQNANPNPYYVRNVCTAGSECSFLWQRYRLGQKIYLNKGMSLYMNTYLQWFIIEDDFAGIALNLSTEVLPALAIKYGQFQDGAVTTIGYIAFFVSCLFMLKMLLKCLYMLYKSIVLKRVLGFSALGMLTSIEEGFQFDISIEEGFQFDIFELVDEDEDIICCDICLDLACDLACEINE
eukprot:g4245.t1